MVSDLVILFVLRTLQYRRLLARLGRRARTASPVTILLVLLLVGGLVLLCLEAPMYVKDFLERSAYPAERLVTPALYGFLLLLFYRSFTRGIHYPPFYLAQGDLVLLLSSPVDQRVVLFARLARSFFTSGLGIAIVCLLSTRFLPVILPGLSPGRIAALGIGVWFILITLADLQWFVFRFRTLRMIARVVKYAVSFVFVLTLVALFVLWVVNPGIFPVGTASAAAGTLPLAIFPHLPALIGLGLLALAASFIAFQTMAGADLERIANYSFFIGESLKLVQGRQLEEARRLAARMSEGRRGNARIKIPGYGFGAGAIAWKSATVLVRQGWQTWPMLAFFFLGAFFVALYVQPFWAKVLGVFYLFFTSANLALTAFQQDLRARDFMHQLPFSPKDIVRGSSVIPTLLLSCLGWVLVTLLWARNRYGFEEYAFLMALTPLGSYLITICRLTSVLAGSHQSGGRNSVAFSLVLLMVGGLSGLAWLLKNGCFPSLWVWGVIFLTGFLGGAILRRVATSHVIKWMEWHD